MELPCRTCSKLRTFEKKNRDGASSVASKLNVSRCDDRRRQFTTLIVQFCVKLDAREAAGRAGLSARAVSCF